MIPVIPASVVANPLSDFNRAIEETRAKNVWGLEYGSIRYSAVHWGEGRLSMTDLMLEHASEQYRDHEEARGQVKPLIEGFFVIHYPSPIQNPIRHTGRKFCLACGCGAPKDKHGTGWYHWTDHPVTCRMMGELAIRTIQELITQNDYRNLSMIMVHFPNEFQEACRRQLEAA